MTRSQINDIAETITRAILEAHIYCNYDNKTPYHAVREIQTGLQFLLFVDLKSNEIKSATIVVLNFPLENIGLTP